MKIFYKYEYYRLIKYIARLNSINYLKNFTFYPYKFFYTHLVV